jgi:hypothetical protein
VKILQTSEGILLKRWGKVYWLVPSEMYFTELPILSGKKVEKLNKKVRDAEETK